MFKRKTLVISLLVACLVLTFASLTYAAEKSPFTGKQLELVTKGDKLLQDKKPTEAITAWTQALEADKKGKNNDAIQMRIGIAYAAAGKGDKAAEAWKKALALNPKNAGAYYNLGALALMQNKLPEAEKNFLQVAKLDPNNPSIHWELARIYLASNKPDQALNEGQTMVKLDSKNPGSHWALVQIYLATKKTDDALKAGQAALALDPKNPDSHWNMANLYVQLGKTDDALKEGQAALALNTNNPDNHWKMAVLYMQLGKNTEGENEAQQVIKLAPKAEIQVYFDLGLIYYNQKQFNKTIECWNKIVALDPKSADIMFSIGKVYLENLNDKVKAKEYLEKAAQLNPQDKEAKALLEKVK